MAPQNLSPDEAAQALAEVVERRRQVAEMSEPLPRRYLTVSVVMAVLFFARMDLPRWAGSTPAGYLAVILIGVVLWATFRQQRVRPHPSLYGVRGWLIIAGVTAMIFVVASVVGILVDGSGLPLPHTVTGVVLGTLIGAGGALLNRWLRRTMKTRTRSIAP